MMKGISIIGLFLAFMVLSPALVYAETVQPLSSSPPISQPLVREGTFALQLAKALEVSTTTNEAEAERLLTGAGIAPRNGWISDYPVTPDILGEVAATIRKAAQSGSLAMTGNDAQRAFQVVADQYSLGVSPASNSAPETGLGTGYYDNSVLDNYYATEGPPVVTYYPPPADYSYLYSWVPYPFWWGDWWFGGYYVLGSFAFPGGYYGYWPGVWYGYRSWFGPGYCYPNWNGKVYWGNRGPWNGGNPNWHGNGTMISNHFRDPVTHAMGTINPAARTAGNIATSRAGSRWATPAAQAGARGILNTSRTRTASTYSGVTGNNRGVAAPYRGSYNPINTSNRYYRSYSPYYSAGRLSGQQHSMSNFTASPSASRSFSAHVQSGSFTSHGFSGFSGGGRGFSGGVSHGGHR